MRSVACSTDRYEHSIYCMLVSVPFCKNSSQHIGQKDVMFTVAITFAYTTKQNAEF